MAKRLLGKVLICVLSLALCFGFVGVKEVHAATNKVINENTGVSYDTLSEAIAALGAGSAEESVTLTVDGVIRETSRHITVDYAGELSIVGGSEGGDIINISTDPDTSGFDKDYAPPNYSTAAGYRQGSISFTKNTRIKTIKDVRFCCSYQNYPYGLMCSHALFFYGMVDELNNIAGANGNSWYYGAGRINICGGCKVGRIINCNRPHNYRAGWYYGENLPGGQELDIMVEAQATVDEIKDCNLIRLWVEGTVGIVENIDMPLESEVNWYNNNKDPLKVFQDGYIGTVKNSKVPGTYVMGTVDTFDGFYSFLGDEGVSEACGGFMISETGRVNRIIGGSTFEHLPDGWEPDRCIKNYSPYPVYLEPDLNGTDVTEGYGRYANYIDDYSGTIVYPTSASGYLYQMSSVAGSDGYYHLTVSNIPGNPVNPTLSKRLLSNDTATIPDMTFTFSFTQQSEWDGVSYVSASTPIADKSVTITDTSDRLTSDAYVGDLTDKKLLEGKVDNVLTDFAPTAAGTYCYLVKENVPNPQLSDVTYTASEFIMLVEVEDTGGTLKPKTVTNILYKDSSGKTKADYTTPPSIFDEKQELIFYNNYGTTGGTTPTGIITNILPFIVIGGAGVGGLALYVVINVKRRKKDIS